MFLVVTLLSFTFPSPPKFLFGPRLIWWSPWLLLFWTLCVLPHGFQIRSGYLAACTLSCLCAVILKVTTGATPAFSTNRGVRCISMYMAWLARLLSHASGFEPPTQWWAAQQCVTKSGALLTELFRRPWPYYLYNVKKMTGIVSCTPLLNVLLLFDSLAGGMILNRTAKPLSSRDCYRLGLEAQKSRNYGLAVEWLQMALKSPGDAEVRSDVIMALADTHYMVRSTLMVLFTTNTRTQRGYPYTARVPIHREGTHTQRGYPYTARVPIHSEGIGWYQSSFSVFGFLNFLKQGQFLPWNNTI